MFLRVPLNVYTYTSSSLFTISSIFPENKCRFPLQLKVHLKSISKKEYSPKKNKKNQHNRQICVGRIAYDQLSNSVVCALWSGHFIHNFNLR